MPHGAKRTYGGHAWMGCWDGGRFILQYRGKTYKVHRLVCEAFHGPAPFEGAVVMHLDEDARNNRPENLAWGSQRENLSAPGYRARLAGQVRGVKAAQDREQIILRRRAGEKAVVIAREYGVAPCTISNLTRGAL